MKRITNVMSVALVTSCLAWAPSNKVSAAEPAQESSTVGPETADIEQVRGKAIDFLRNTQSDDGSWTIPTAPGISGLVTVSLLNSGLSAADPTVAKALKHLETFIQDDGGIYFEGSTHRNYETCLAMMAFHTANADGQYDAVIANAQRFLRGLQWDEGEGLESSDAGFGGMGYGKHQRPDLSNTQIAIEALRSIGVDADDPAIQKALDFVSRTQNLETEHNTTPFASKVNDGGFYYTPAAGGTSQAGKTPNGGLRSYGSMTYAGLKSMIYAGLTVDDPRVKAALSWIERFYTVNENPGLGRQGLYYYYHTFAKALSILELDYVVDAKGVKHDWRKDLTSQLARLQKGNGSWVNKAARWYEGDPNLATAYSLMALSYCDPQPATVETPAK